MRISVTREIDLDVVTLRAEMEPRYWEDATVNGVSESDENPTIPLRDGDAWRLDIDLETGRIHGWPAGVTASTHYKVCDAGRYSLLDAAGAPVVAREGYVPSMLAPSGNGYGDYVILEINGDGTIQGWRPELGIFVAD